MNLLQALVLGVVEGVTEYLPVSSTGHLVVAQRLLGIPASVEANAYAICIQAGAIAAVLLLYRQRIAQMLRGLAGKDAAGRGLLVALAVAFLPAAGLGPFLDDRIEAVLFGHRPIAVAWIVGGVVILWFSRSRRDRPDTGRGLEAIDLRTALLIGLAQCLSMIPGTSRSLVTILAGALCGLSLAAAVEFSFLLGLVTLSAATAYKGLKEHAALFAAYTPAVMLAGFLAAFLFAAIAVKWMVAWLSRHGLEVFAYWRFAAALVAILVLG